MIFANPNRNQKPMSTKSTTKSSSALLIVLLVLITFPFWIGLFAAVVGTVGGVFGAVFGVIGGLLGAFFGIITWPIKALFGHGDWFPHINGYTIVVIAIVVYLISKSRK
jgi:hypothetical protein